jgi:hypothetical protein
MSKVYGSLSFLGETLPNGDFLFFIYKIYFILFFQTGKN